VAATPDDILGHSSAVTVSKGYLLAMSRSLESRRTTAAPATPSSRPCSRPAT
jgi:hypothetical protein